MNWYYNLKIGTKLMSGFVLVALIAGLIGYVGYTGISLIGDSQDELYQDRLIPIADLGEANGALLTMRGNLLAAANAPSEELKQKYLATINELTATTDRLTNKYAATKLVKEEEEGLKKFRDAWSEYKPIVQHAVDLINEKKNEEALSLIFGAGLAPITESRKNLAELIVVNQRIAEELDKQSDKERSATAREMLIFVIVGILIALGLGIFISRIISRPINALITNIDNADLNSQFNSDQKDEIGDLQRSFDKFTGSLRETLTKVMETSGAVASACSEISSSTEQMAAGSQEQTSQAAEVASAVEEMTSTIVENAKTASLTAETARKAKQAAEQGGAVVVETVNGMKRISDVVSQSAQTVQDLGKSSDQIGQIIGVIDDIADQTNLLALNAAIEAARAGEQGRGFAVVADEVRKLAERTTKATKEIAGMIKQIQTETKRAVEAMGQGTAEVENGKQLADKAGASLGEIVEISQKVTDMIAQIAAASEQQSSASEQISKNVEAISAVTGETAQGTQQIARAADDLNKLTEELQTLLERFNLGTSEHRRDEHRPQHQVQSHTRTATKGSTPRIGGRH
ncbi:MAG: methyl-accepting chemotaxis protein [Ignavibacteriales bacterium]|nr:methyl-accepting chemotaxis protein [Ignavibacteriales bacterium]